MRTAITLTLGEANEILALLSELPIKYISTVQAVQQRLTAKFAAPVVVEDAALPEDAAA